jgi:periplasmic protein TonB
MQKPGDAQSKPPLPRAQPASKAGSTAMGRAQPTTPPDPRKGRAEAPRSKPNAPDKANYAKRLEERFSAARRMPGDGPTKAAPRFTRDELKNTVLAFGLVPTMQVAFLASLTAHLFVILGVGFKMPSASQFAAPHNQLEVVLVNSKTERAPEKADALAQANLDGGGNTDQKLRASTPLPNVEMRQSEQDLADATQRLQRLEQEAAKLMSSINSKRRTPQGDVAETPAAKASPSEAAELAEKSLEIARLEAQIKLQFQQYQERPKRQFIGARTREYRFAQYVDAWRVKIERVGNLNYPDEARRRQVYGNLQLTVAIKATGEVEAIEINKSSGHRILDEAARRIVMLAAPFEPFPPAIRRDTDILHITRTWQFTRSDLVMEELPGGR